MPTDPAIDFLLVEDDEADADLMKRALENGGLEVRVNVVRDGEQAMNYLHRLGHRFAAATRPDIILLDWHLPRKTGQQVLNDIKGDDLLRRIPVVILTSSLDELEAQSPYDSFANCCVPKPSDHQELALTVQRIEAFWHRVARRP